jgi:hypothetical protein
VSARVSFGRRASASASVDAEAIDFNLILSRRRSTRELNVWTSISI